MSDNNKSRERCESEISVLLKRVSELERLDAMHREDELKWKDRKTHIAAEINQRIREVELLYTLLLSQSNNIAFAKMGGGVPSVGESKDVDSRLRNICCAYLIKGGRTFGTNE
jgi:hypothetical protein